MNDQLYKRLANRIDFNINSLELNRRAVAQALSSPHFSTGVALISPGWLIKFDDSICVIGLNAIELTDTLQWCTRLDGTPDKLVNDIKRTFIQFWDLVKRDPKLSTDLLSDNLVNDIELSIISSNPVADERNYTITIKDDLTDGWKATRHRHLFYYLKKLFIVLTTYIFSVECVVDTYCLNVKTTGAKC